LLISSSAAVAEIAVNGRVVATISTESATAITLLKDFAIKIPPS
jgi:hypothetical protein